MSEGKITTHATISAVLTLAVSVATAFGLGYVGVPVVLALPCTILSGAVMFGLCAWDFGRRLRANNPEPLPFYNMLAEEHARWSDATFGTPDVRGPLGPLDHLRKELDELAENPYDPEEYADAQLLLWDASRRAGVNAADLLRHTAAKLQKNKRRKWPKQTDPNKAVEHDRSTTEGGS